MKQHLQKLIPLLLVLVSLSSNTIEAKDLTLKSAPVQFYFSPRGGCTEAIVNELRKAKHEILVQAYSFTSKEIATALVDAKRRGVRTGIVLDKSNKTTKYSAGDYTAHMGIPTYMDSAHAIAHNKIMIIDREVVITGSFNFTSAAEEKNAENLLIVSSKELAKEYVRNWNEHRKHSAVYKGR